MDLGTIFNPFESIADDMAVKQQPKPDQRSRYASDSIRFLPDSRKHPMSIKVCYFFFLQNMSYKFI